MMVESVEQLNEGSVKMQIIHNLLADSQIADDIAGKQTTKEEALKMINEFLGTMSEDAFYKDLVDKGYFDKNTLSELVTSSKEKGGREADKKIVQELLGMFAEGNIPKEYLDMINGELEKFKSDLSNLTSEKESIENVLNQFIEKDGSYILFPPEGLTEEDRTTLIKQLEAVNRNITFLEDKISEIKAFTEDDLNKDVSAINDKDNERMKGIQMENAILETLEQYEMWRVNMTNAPAATVKEDDGKGPSGVNTNVDFVDKEFRDRNGVGGNNVHSLLTNPFLKTAGYHALALEQYKIYEERKANGKPLSKSELMHYENVMSQLRFFKASESVVNWTKLEGNKLRIVHRNNIPAEMQDKIVFYDGNMPEGTKIEKRYVYEKDLKDYTTEDNENIMLVLVDKDLKPVLIDGEMAYTSMPDAKLRYPNGNYMYNEALDLNKDGSIKEGVNKVAKIHSEHRKDLLEKHRFYLLQNKWKI